MEIPQSDAEHLVSASPTTIAHRRQFARTANAEIRARITFVVKMRCAVSLITVQVVNVHQIHEAIQQLNVQKLSVMIKMIALLAGLVSTSNVSILVHYQMCVGKMQNVKPKTTLEYVRARLALLVILNLAVYQSSTVAVINSVQVAIGAMEVFVQRLVPAVATV